MNNVRFSPDICVRAEELAHYILDTACTIREAAQVYGISKSTVHNDVHYRLKYINLSLYEAVQRVLDYNIAVRHIRGGASTKAMYSHN